MNYTSEQLRQDIDKGRLRPVYFLYGPEEYLKEQAVQGVLGKLVTPDLKEFNLDVLYGDETDAASIIDRVASLPMMTERRVVLVRNVDHLPIEERRKILEYSTPSEKRKLLEALEKDIQKTKKDLLEGKERSDPGRREAAVELDRMLSRKGDILKGLTFAFPHACLLLTAADGDISRMFHRSIRKKKTSGRKSAAGAAGRSDFRPRGSDRSEAKASPDSPWLNQFADRVIAGVEFSQPPDRDIPKRVRELSRNHGKSIDPEAVDLLVKAIGGDLMALDNELAKLSIFIDERPEIGPRDVEMVVGELKVRSVFDLCHAIPSGDRSRSFSLLGHLLESGIAVPQLTGALRWKFTQLARGRHGRGGSRAPQIDDDCLAAVFDLLYQTEFSVNTGRQSPRMAMTLLVDQLCRLFGTREK